MVLLESDDGRAAVRLGHDTARLVSDSQGHGRQPLDGNITRLPGSAAPVQTPFRRTRWSAILRTGAPVRDEDGPTGGPEGHPGVSTSTRGRSMADHSPARRASAVASVL